MKKYFKIISNSIAYTLRGISYLIPRNKDKWVVGNSRGFNNNTKYFFIHAKTVLEKNKCYIVEIGLDWTLLIVFNRCKMEAVKGYPPYDTGA